MESLQENAYIICACAKILDDGGPGLQKEQGHRVRPLAEHLHNVLRQTRQSNSLNEQLFRHRQVGQQNDW